MTFTSGPWAPTKPHSRRIWFVQAATTIRFFTVSVRSCHTVSTFSMRHFRSKRAAMCANLRRRRWFSEGALRTRQSVRAADSEKSPLTAIIVWSMLAGEIRETTLREGEWRRLTLAIGIGLALLPATLYAQSVPGALPESTAALVRGDWPAYAGTYTAARYSPLAQIDRGNAKDLHVAWRWKSPDMAIKEANPKVGPTRANESTPLMIGGVLYTSTSLSQVAAIDAFTGETRWVFDPKIYENGLGIPANDGWLHRGVA